MSTPAGAAMSRRRGPSPARPTNETGKGFKLDMPTIPTVPRALRAALLAGSLLAAAGCLNTQSAALQEQPAPLGSPADACRAAAAAEGFTVIEVRDLREVSDGYWEARFVIQDPELRNLLGCRHSADDGFTEVVRLDEE